MSSYETRVNEAAAEFDVEYEHRLSKLRHETMFALADKYGVDRRNLDSKLRGEDYE